VDGVLLQVHPGEFVGLLGPNGCGKSSLLRPDAGRVALDGQDVWQAWEAVRHTGYGEAVRLN
jgi:ABC-type multidrug transport system ATPase subunit